MDTADLDTLLAKEKISFGDKAYVIKAGVFYVCGNDQTWYAM